ncbi:uncharacterized protein F5891DRAFT_1282927 [Suillus fuscotomentosus]|uniref:Uncharacterized protein n=1 Tax=Suillus fuscotomentosus TaxID=1912939 RepID=A0AAD4HD63_9AGAM|nr:uncharacterized protein F5891DRAFT_1282927 [Suillus fuscotomentosus]KAG1889048.1 hypothetical protein F5891DRAFT_1282927 [Suillus fuscotomentosus]
MPFRSSWVMANKQATINLYHASSLKLQLRHEKLDCNPDTVSLQRRTSPSNSVLRAHASPRCPSYHSTSPKSIGSCIQAKSWLRAGRCIVAATHLSLELGAEGSCIISAPALPSDIPHIYWFMYPRKVVAAHGRCIVAATHLSLELGAEGSCIISVPTLLSDIPRIYWFMHPHKVVAARGRHIVAATHFSCATLPGLTRLHCLL